ncbi:MAG TPA: ABC transporter ATP-binding protein [Candidatus Binatia bacterium]|nr:ABC transporter ATP-binding protein [Candidatus Binatia bacterium]
MTTTISPSPTTSPSSGQAARSATVLHSLALEIVGATKRFRPNRRRAPIVAVDAVDLVVPRGGVVGILGANGSGKSTLIRLIAGLLTLDAGRIRVFGHDVERDGLVVRRHLNRVSVDAAFFKKLSPLENLRFAARLYGLDPRVADERAARILERLGLDRRRLDRPMEQLSRGMQQKVAVARALLTSPTLLLLDEPTTGLDPRSKRDVQAFVAELRRTHDTTVLLTTHDLDEAAELCDRLAILDRGRIVVDAPPAEVARLAADRFGGPATLENAFLAFTGRDLEVDLDDEPADEAEDDR